MSRKRRRITRPLDRRDGFAPAPHRLGARRAHREYAGSGGMDSESDCGGEGKRVGSEEFAGVVELSTSDLLSSMA